MIASSQTQTQPSAHYPDFDDPMLEAIVRGLLTDCMLKDDMRFTASAINEWMSNPANQAKLQNVHRAFNFQAELVAAQSRCEMILALVALVKNPECRPETVRKACTEVLRSAADPSRRKSKVTDEGTSEAGDAQQRTDAATSNHPANPQSTAKQAEPQANHSKGSAPHTNGQSASKPHAGGSVPPPNNAAAAATSKPASPKPPHDVPRIPIPPHSR